MGHGADVIGYAFDGAIYCLEHAPEGARSEEGSPVFQCDEGGLEEVCDTCRHSLGCVEGYDMDDCPACTRKDAQRRVN